MIVDFTISNFRSLRDEQMISMSVEGARSRHATNFSLFESDRIAVLRSAAILGANASGKTNALRALAALRWLIATSGRKDGQVIPPYEPFMLSEASRKLPVRFEIEFVLPTAVRYRYEVAFVRDRIIEERLISYANRSRALMFERGPQDSWETIKFGGTYKGGSRKFPFFDNTTYLARAGNDASSPQFIRDIYNYFQRMTYIPANATPLAAIALKDGSLLRAVSELICLADTGVSEITLEEKESSGEIRLPEGISDDMREAIIAQNRFETKYWIKSEAGELISFDEDEMSHGTVRLFELLPVILSAFQDGSVVVIDEIDAHLHTDLVNLILQLFHDDEVNARGAQILFSTHDTNILDSGLLRRDQIWFASKESGVSSIKGLDEYDKKYVRQDSPFEAFYREGRLGALPCLSYKSIKLALMDALNEITD